MRSWSIGAASGTQMMEADDAAGEVASFTGWTISGVAVLVAIVTVWIIGI